MGKSRQHGHECRLVYLPITSPFCADKLQQDHVVSPVEACWWQDFVVLIPPGVEDPQLVLRVFLIFSWITWPFQSSMDVDTFSYSRCRSFPIPRSWAHAWKFDHIICQTASTVSLCALVVRLYDFAIHALISCRLDYCNSILYNVPKSKTDRLQRLQNQCARILTKSPRREHITPVLIKLQWLKIQDRIIYTMLMLTYKSYYNMAPPYLCELIN